MSSDTQEIASILNGTIRGDIKWVKCPCCDIDGIEFKWFDDNGNEVKSTEPGALRSIEYCDECHGIAFKSNDVKWEK